LFAQLGQLFERFAPDDPLNASWRQISSAPTLITLRRE
jgi:hypothetical protein